MFFLQRFFQLTFNTDMMGKIFVLGMFLASLYIHSFLRQSEGREGEMFHLLVHFLGGCNSRKAVTPARFPWKWQGLECYLIFGRGNGEVSGKEVQR